MRYAKTSEGGVLALDGETKPYSTHHLAYHMHVGGGNEVWQGNWILDVDLLDTVEISEAEAWKLAPALMKALSEVKGLTR